MAAALAATWKERAEFETRVSYGGFSYVSMSRG